MHVNREDNIQFKCNKYEKSFKILRYLIDHEKRVHKKLVIDIKCQYCEKVYKSLNYCKKHENCCPLKERSQTETNSQVDSPPKKTSTIKFFTRL